MAQGVELRWQGLPATTVDGGPDVSAQRVKLADLPSLLPSTTRRVTAAERARQLEDRYQGYLRRISFPTP